MRGRRRSAYVPPPYPTAAVLSEAHRAALHASGVSDDTIAAARLYTCSDRRDVMMLLGRSTSVPVGDVLVFPFCDPGTTAPHGYRIRPDTPRVQDPDADRKTPRTVKYDQPGGAGVMVFWPPGAADWVSDATRTLYWTEGEKKALALTQRGYACVGLTGVWMWSDPERHRKHGGYYLIDRIASHAVVAGRHHVIVWDQDAWTKRDVMQAARKLAGVLAGLGAASVRFVTPPDGPAKGIDDYVAGHDDAAARELLCDAPIELTADDPLDGADVELSTVRWADGAPVPPGLRMPRGWEITGEGVLLRNGAERAVVVSPRAGFIAARSVDHDTGEEWATITFRRPTGWDVATVPRRALMDARAMVAELTPRGAPVNSVTARELVTWWAAFEQTNEAALPAAKMMSHTGWVTPAVYMLHECVWGGDADPCIGPSPAITRVCAALTPRGESTAAHGAAWVTGATMRTLIGAALAAPMLKPIGLRGFGLHACGDTSRGKSTMLRIVASMYGDAADPAWVGTWNATANALESRAARLCDLPLILDESGTADRAHVQRLMYTLINGEGRGRLTRESAASAVLAWRTVVISTGESPITDERQASGVLARVLTLDVNGFGTLDGDSVAIERLRAACEAERGAVAAAWISHLCTMTADEWAAARARWGELRTKLLDGSRKGIQARQADYYALIALAQELACHVFGWESHGEDLHVPRAEAQPSSDRMLDVVASWVSQRADAFPRADTTSAGALKVRASDAHGIRFGIRVLDQYGETSEILIDPAAFRDKCTEHGVSARHVLQDWAARGLIRIPNREASGTQRYDVMRTEESRGRSRWVVWLGWDAAVSGETE